MKTFSLWLGTILAVLLPLTIMASTIRSGETVRIDQPVAGNLYLAGGEVYINAPIGGDFIAAGGQIEVSAPIGDDGLVAGGEIAINAPVSGDLRIGGGQITIRQNIGGDLVVLSGEVIIAEGVAIGGDLMVLGGEIEMNGAVRGVIRISGGEFRMGGSASGGIEAKCGEITINGEVNGPARLSAGELDLGSNAVFTGDVRYWQGAGELDFSDHLRNGATATFDPSLQLSGGAWDKEEVKRGMFLFSIYRFLAGVVLIVLLVNFFHRFFSRYAGRLTDNMAGSFGYGMLYLIGLPILIVLAMITIIGIPVGFILAAGYGITLALAGALVSVILAYELEKFQGRNWSKSTMMLIAVGISLGIRLVDFIPFAGSLVLFLLIAVVFGYLYQNIRVDRKKPPYTQDADIV